MTHNSIDLTGVPGLDEPILADDYPVYADYLYVADGKVVRPDWFNITVGEFKRREGYAEVGYAVLFGNRGGCDIYGRREALK